MKNFKELERGDIVKNGFNGRTYVVMSNYGERVTAAETVDMTNPNEWSLASKSNHEEQAWLIDSDKEKLVDQKDNKDMTVDELIEMLKQHSENNLGDYFVGCNNEYRLVNGRSADIDHTDKTINLPGVG